MSNEESNGYARPDQLFGQPMQRRYKDVVIDGQKFRLRSLNASEAAKFARESESKNGQLSVNARLIVLTCVDADGNQIFGKENIADWQKMDARMVASLANEAIAHAGLTEDEEDAEKN